MDLAAVPVRAEGGSRTHCIRFTRAAPHQFGFIGFNQSEWLDLNQRSSAPEADGDNQAPLHSDSVSQLPL